MNFILYSFRRYHQLTKEEVAKKLHLNLPAYDLLESGDRPVKQKLAHKFSVIYQAPHYVFLIEPAIATVQLVFNHSHFENSNGFVQNLYTKTNTKTEQLLDQHAQLLKQLYTKLEKNSTHQIR